MIAAPSDSQWAALCEAMDRPELIEQYPDEEDRVEHADELRPVVSEWVAQHTKDEVADMIAEDVPCGPINTAADIFDDPHFEQRGMLPSVEHADTGEEVELAGSPINFSETTADVERRAPLLGEHSQEILAEFGFDENRIKELTTREIVNATDKQTEN